MLSKNIKSSVPLTLVCDGRCTKAWGINARPRVQVSDLEDDILYLADAELGVAPDDPGTYEGGCAKPCTPSSRLNKWCARECERSRIVQTGEDIVLSDFTVRLRNIPM